MGLTKQQLEALNVSSFPNNTTGLITPEILRTYNSSSIEATVNQDIYTADSASFNSRILAVDDSLVTTASFNAYTQSTNVFTASISTSVGLLQTFSGSQYKADSSSFNSRINSATGSLLLTASFDNGTRNLTFTKGDSTTFNVNIPDVSGSTINTGSLVTTSSFNSYTSSQDFKNTTFATTSSVNDLSASLYFTDTTQSNNIASNSSSIGLLQTFSGSQYKNDSSSFDSRINAAGGQPQIQDDGSILGNATSFNFNGAGVTATLSAGTASVTIPGGGGSIDTGSFATTGSNTFVGNQTLSSSKIIFTATGSNNNGLAWNTGGNVYSDQNKLNFSAIEAGLDFSVNGTTSNDVLFRNTSPSGGIQFSANGGILRLLSPGNSIEISGSGGTFIQGLNFTTYSSSVSDRFNSQDFKNTTFATTASNAFTGQQTLTDVDLLNQITLDDHSGSLVLFAKGFTSSSLTHISASSAGVGNIIFKTNNNTLTTIVSGSNNLFVNAGTPTTGFTRYIGGSGNIMLGQANVPQISSSMTISPTMNNNYFGGNNTTLNMRGPISSSAWTISANNVIGTINIGSSAGFNAQGIQSGLTMTANTIAGTLNVTAVNTLSSSVSFTNNIINGTAGINANSSSVSLLFNNINDNAFALNNNYFSSSAGVGSIALNRSTIGGQAQTITIQGSQPAGTTNVPSYSDNAIFGGGNILFGDVSSARVVSTNAYHSAIRNVIGGNQLIISGSSLLGDSSTFGSAYFGRWNANDGIRNKTSDIVFAVGTGNSTARKTGFLIDSGSNTFVEGTLNVSGSTSFTGSLTIQSGSSFFANGNKQFNVGAFSSLVTQSGSANVSQSMNFGTTDISDGVSIASNSRITLANSGTYNIQFSAQTQATGGADNLYIWLKKNGSNVAASAGNVEIANNQEVIAAWNYVVDASSNDYFELCWQAGNVGTILLAENASGNIPSIPSIILTVTQVR